MAIGMDDLREFGLVDEDTAKSNGQPSPKLRVLDVGYMLSTVPPPVPWVVEPLLVAGCVTMLAGREGQGKSMLALALASAIGHGSTMAGLDCEAGQVLYVDAENGEREAHRRVRSLCVKPETLVYVEAQGFNLGADIELIAGLVDEHEPTVVMLDSLRSLAPGLDENDSKQAEAAVRPVSRLAQKHEIPVLLLHHAGKGGHEYRGSTAIGAAVELGFTLSRHEEDPDKRTRRKVACWKSRPAPEPEERWIAMGSHEGLITLAEAEPYRGERHRDRDDHRGDVLDALDGMPRSERQIAKETGVARTTLQRLLRDLEADRLALKVPRGWVAHAPDALDGGPPGPSPKNGFSKPNPGGPPVGPRRGVGHVGHRGNGHDPDAAEYAERYHKRQAEGRWGAS